MKERIDPEDVVAGSHPELVTNACILKTQVGVEKDVRAQFSLRTALPSSISLKHKSAGISFSIDITESRICSLLPSVTRAVLNDRPILLGGLNSLFDHTHQGFEVHATGS